MGEPRMTIPTQRVLRALLADVAAELYGAEIAEAAGLASGTVHPILARFERIGWVESRWEEVDPRRAGRRAATTGSPAPGCHSRGRRWLVRTGRGPDGWFPPR